MFRAKGHGSIHVFFCFLNLIAGGDSSLQADGEVSGAFVFTGLEAGGERITLASNGCEGRLAAAGYRMLAGYIQAWAPK